MPVSLNSSIVPQVRDLWEEFVSSGLPDSTARSPRPHHTGELPGLKERRVVIADALGLSEESCRSVLAYIRYSATKALRDCKLSGVIEPDLLVFAARRVRCCDGPEETVSCLTACTDFLKAQSKNPDLISLLTLKDAVARYNERISDLPGGLSPNTPSSLTLSFFARLNAGEPTIAALEQVIIQARSDIVSEGVSQNNDGALKSGEPPASPPIVQVLDDDEIRDSDDRGVSGDMMDYDFEAKREWRRAFARFIRDNFSTAELSIARVLCLPGRAVEPEVRHYLEMGVKPENIFAVEGGRPEAREEFTSNCRRLGIRYILGRLERVVDGFPAGQPFSIVNLDFHGQLDATKHRTFTRIPVAEDAVFILNVLGKRESPAVREQLAKASLHFQRYADELVDAVLSGRPVDDDKLVAGWEQVPLSEVRKEHVLDSWMLLGTAVPTGNKLLDVAFDEYWRTSLEPKLTFGGSLWVKRALASELLRVPNATTFALAKDELCSRRRSRMFRDFDFDAMGGVVSRLISGLRFRRPSVSYPYLSEPNSSPFISSFSYSSALETLRARHSAVLESLARILCLDLRPKKRSQLPKASQTVACIYSAENRHGVVIPDRDNLLPQHFFAVEFPALAEKVRVSLLALRSLFLDLEAARTQRKLWYDYKYSSQTIPLKIKDW
jgi:hypothetical protein